MTLSTNPPRGTSDRYPDEFRVRKYIFDTWRKVCQSFGYEEYLGPLVEDSAIWKAKSGEDVGGTELTLLTDREGNISDIALRPEMTPTVTRMVSKKRQELPKPVKRFSIANFYRNERPQRGRNREFWQLNVDCFGEDSIYADIEILSMALELMSSFGATADHYVLYLNHRRLITIFLLEIVGINEANKDVVMRIMDKWHKLSLADFSKALTDALLTADQASEVIRFMHIETIDELMTLFPALHTYDALQEIKELIDSLEQLGYAHYIQFKPSLMRGFDYYDGMVFEVFDKHPDNNRALFGGGRYNGLADIFGMKEPLPAVGFAPGDEPMTLFLTSWGLDTMTHDIQESRYAPLLDASLVVPLYTLVKTLREQGKVIEMSLSVKKLAKSFQYAEKKGHSHVIIFGPEEAQQGGYQVKELRTGAQKTYTI